MPRRSESFCTSELPCVIEDLDTYFWISRKRGEMGPEIRRTKSADPVLPSVPQVDGPTEQRKANKKSKSKKKSNNKKNKNKGKGKAVEVEVAVEDNVVVAVVDSGCDVAKEGQQQKQTENGDDHRVDDVVAATDSAISTAAGGEEVKNGDNLPPPYSSAGEDTSIGEPASSVVTNSPVARMAPVAEAAVLKAKILEAMKRKERLERQIQEERNSNAQASSSQRSVPAKSDTSSISQQRPDTGSVDNLSQVNRSQHSPVSEMRVTGNNSQPSTSVVNYSSEEAVRDCCTCLTYLNTVSAKSDTETPSDVGQGVEGGSTVAERNTSIGKKSVVDEKGKGVDSLSTHLIQLFESRELCDFHFKLTSSSNGLYQSTIIPVQVAVIARSPFVAALLRTQLYREGHREIAVTLGDQVNLIQGFEQAIRNLYGAPLLHGEQLRTEALAVLGYTEESQSMYPFPIRTAMLDLAFSYAASGAFLHVSGVLEAGIRMALELIDWSTVETIIHFGLRVDRFSIILEGTETPPGSPRANHTRSGHVLVRNRQLRDIWAPLLVRAALSFIAESIDDKFVLYSQAQSLHVPNRIPESLNTGPGVIGSEPGSASANSTTTESKPNRETLVASAVLISLPFVHLQEVFRTLSSRRVLSNNLAQAIMSERESRRLQALRELGKKGEINEKNLPSETKELGYGEYLVFKSVCKQGQGPVTVTTEVSLEREWIGCRSPDAKQ
ncbi:hypothetical protein AtubIFM55763_003389 [Aspergillus tubingensis]|uniref:Uncharacterized protein n=1 Tax=Aspergillus tubingensis TaxID=5068 RepID=A0A9W6ATI6_ASPTU|nr:hypothetical protein AtubIFM54640_004865 [Aspergillus tubingensis]GLA68320.1 hypothetical protein AtubIFM55763_003389 [Aspergillus tubingensis]GLA87257.1 hypothetical protein AtubIFM56815_001679 [Aspergillus tubingensis]GLA96942.1 hypothetical protein AtubIFM57143_004425 [Aspergillus tubingensis]GLB19123.1 hypothetical protein AtubIFM61612_009026 [Aspergillus tubingensis]